METTFWSLDWGESQRVRPPIQALYCTLCQIFLLASEWRPSPLRSAVLWTPVVLWFSIKPMLVSKFSIAWYQIGRLVVLVSSPASFSQHYTSHKFAKPCTEHVILRQWRGSSGLKELNLLQKLLSILRAYICLSDHFISYCELASHRIPYLHQVSLMREWYILASVVVIALFFYKVTPHCVMMRFHF